MTTTWFNTGAAVPDTVSFGASLAAAPTNAQDNDTFVVTTTGDATGTVVDVFKYDLQTGQWVSINLDTDVSNVASALVGTALTVELTEDGNTLLTTTDLQPILTELTFSSTPGAPTGGTPVDNDTHLVTSDGTPSGDILEQWMYDEQTGVWVEVPVATACPGPMTRAALLALRNSGGLSKDCHYVLTDYNRGTVGAASILLHAVDANTLSMDASVKTAFDNVAWEGRYDIDTNRIVELRDNLGNVVNGQETVDVFPWGNAALYDNFVDEPALFTYTQGNVFDNRFETGSRVTLGGASGNFARNVVGEDSDVTWQNGDFRDNQIGTDAIVVANTTGDFDNNRVHSFARVDVTGTGNVDQNEIGENSNVTVPAGAFINNVIGSDVTWNGVGGSVYENTISNGSIVTQTTARNVYQNDITRTSSVTLGDQNFFQNRVEFSVLNFTGSTGNGVRYCSFDGARTVNAQNVAVLDWAYSSFKNLSSATVNDAQRCYLRYCAFENYGRLLQSAGTQFDANYTGVRDYSYIQVLNGRLYANNSTLSGVSYIQQNTPNTNRVDRVTVRSASRIRFLGTASGCRVYYSTVMSGSFIEHRGSSAGCYVYYCEATSSSQIYSNNSVNWRCYYNSVSGNSEISSQGMTGTHYTYYCVGAAHGYIRMRDGLGRFYAIHASGQGLVTLTGGTANSRLYYSTIQAYYYLNLNATSLPATRTAIAASGRRSYTPTTAIPNGTFTQNF